MKGVLYASTVILMMASCCSCEDDSQGGGALSEKPALEGTLAWHMISDDGSDASHLYVSDIRSGESICLSETWTIRNPRYPKFSPDGTRLLFMAKYRGSWEVFSYDLTDGKQPECLTASLDGEDAWPSYVPNGKTILFEHKGQIWTLSEEGKAEPVTYDMSTSHNSPVKDVSSERYVFSTGSDDKSYIGLYDASSGAFKILYDSKGPDVHLCADPSGRIFFTSKSSDSYRKQIFQGNFDGVKLRSLPFNSSDADYDDAFVVNGDWLVVSSNRNGTVGGYDLWLANVSDGTVYALPVNTTDNEGGTAYTQYTHQIAMPEDGGYKPSEPGQDNITSDKNRPELKGKMVYHHYTSYDAMDSKMYIYDFEENSLKCISEGWKNVKHPMNGHFSPNGDFVTFMGIGDGGTWDVFVYYFGEKQPVNLTLEGDYRDEDPKVSYDGNRIVFKRNDRISEINLEDRSLKVLSSISGSGHHSMPYYTIDGKKAVCGCGSEGEDYIGLWDFATSTMKVLYDRKGVVEYYPITLDAESFYYSAHVSQTNRHDQLYKGFIDGSPSQKLKFNNTNADYSDACPVSAGWLILCSTRSDSKGGYDLYIAHETSGAIYPLSDYNSSINTSLNELGADYYGK